MHTKEPWESHKSIVYLGGLAGGFDMRNCPDSEDNARRIVACVNACAGINDVEIDDVVNSGGIKKALNTAYSDRDFIKQQRDELLSALKAYQKAGFGNSTDFMLQTEAFNMASKAIAKCES